MAAIEPDSGAISGHEHVGPGMLLRKARESASISVHDVAAQLHLDVRTIASLERDAFDELPAPTFVRGYLRGYARLLNLPVSPVLEAYDREGFHPPDLVADIAEKPQAQSGDLPVRMLTYLIVVVLASLVVWWWYDREMATPPDYSAAGTPAMGVTEQNPDGTGEGNDTSVRIADGSEPTAGQSGSGDGSSAQGGPTTGAAAAPQPAQQVPAPEPEAPPLDINKRVENELAQVEQSLAESGSPAAGTLIETGPETSQSTPPTVATDDASAAAQGASAAAVAAPAKASLRLEFPIEAWVEINDGNGAKLFFNLVKPGRVLELTGEPPIRVLLGRSKGVKLRFNGEPVDIKPHVRKGGVAQITLGG